MWPRFQTARLVQGVFVSSYAPFVVWTVRGRSEGNWPHSGVFLQGLGKCRWNGRFSISSSNHSSMMIGTTMISKKTTNKTNKNVNGNENGKETKSSDHMMTLHEVISDWNVMVVLMMLLKCYCKERWCWCPRWGTQCWCADREQLTQFKCQQW